MELEIQPFQAKISMSLLLYAFSIYMATLITAKH